MIFRKLIYISVFLSCSCSTIQEHDPLILSQADFFKIIKANDISLDSPREGEWLYTQKESGQTFEEYKKSKPIRPSKNKIIFLEPIGKFTKKQEELLKSTTDYVQIFFQINTQLLREIPDNLIPDSARRLRKKGNEQLLAPYILHNLLKNNFPVNAMVLMAITEKDLYPKDDWNFIFGLASYNDKIGVSSINRLYSGTLDSTNFTKCLSRLIQVASHEIGHMFSLQHCINARCVMNGSNSLFETDLQPNRLCSECLKKLSWNIQFDNIKRLKSLDNYFELHKIYKDYELAKADYDNVISENQ